MENYNPIVRQYEDQVLSGEIMAGRLERLAVERQRKDLAYGHNRGLHFDCEAGELILDFFKILNIGPDQPFTLMPWQMFELYVFYGWKNSEGKRRFRKKYKSISRKNGKTALESGQVMYHLVMEGLSRAEAYVSATTERQAKITFDDAIVILENTPDLQDVLDSTSTTIFHKDRRNGSKFQYLTSNPKTADGTRPSFYLIDEYHEFDDDKMIQKMGTGTMNREQPIGNIVTTRGLRKTTPCFINEQKLYIPILEGIVTADSTFVYIFSQDSEDEFGKPETWRKSNPALGTLVKIQDMISEKEDAVRKGQESMNAFKALNLNMWVDAVVSFISTEEWKSGGKAFDEEELKGKTCWAGLDMSQRGDFTALCLYFPPEGWEEYDTTDIPEEFEGKVAYPRAPTKIPGEHKALWWLWIPEDTVGKRVDNGLTDLRDWIEDGFVEVMEGNVIDPRVIEEKIKSLADIYQIHSLAYDPYNAASTAISINEYGITARELKQTMPFVATPTQELQYLIKKKQFNHGFNPVLAWMAKNAVPKKDMAGNIRIVKNDKRSPENVDGMAALVDAIAMWMMHDHQITSGGVYTW